MVPLGRAGAGAEGHVSFTLSGAKDKSGAGIFKTREVRVQYIHKRHGGLQTKVWFTF
jgi:hypothetical protein